MKKIITTIAVTAISISMRLTAYAADMLDKNYIESEIWEDMWLGKSDNGTEFPEASFKHHLLDKWITQNYGSDDFDWSELGELKYQYKRYYENYIAGWDFNDDDNGNWTIDTEEHSYHFQLINHTWNMIDENGDTVDTFSPISTEELQPNNNYANQNGSSSNRVIGQITEEAKTTSENEDSQKSVKHNKGTIMPVIIRIIALVGIGAVLLFFRKNKK